MNDLFDGIVKAIRLIIRLIRKPVFYKSEGAKLIYENRTRI